MARKKKILPNWIPVYVTGRDGFAEKLTEALTQSSYPFMPGYYYDSSASTAHTLVWLDDNVSLKKYKQAIGPRIIWKYRIRFFRTLPEFTRFACRSLYEEKEEEIETAA